MIWESKYWKAPLLDASRLIWAALDGPLPDEGELGRLEYSIMTGFFSIRKLIEAQTKVSDATQQLSVQLTRYGTNEVPKRPNLMNRHRVEQFYDFANSHSVTKSIGYISNQFVHSYIFNFEMDEEGKLSGILFASDKDKNKFCNFVSLKRIAEIFIEFGNDYPSELNIQRDSNGEWQTVKNR